MEPEIIVVTAAYGHQQIAALGGQRALLPIIQQAGADGVEIRRELFDDTTSMTCPRWRWPLISTGCAPAILYPIPCSVRTVS